MNQRAWLFAFAVMLMGCSAPAPKKDYVDACFVGWDKSNAELKQVIVEREKERSQWTSLIKESMKAAYIKGFADGFKAAKAGR